MRRSSFQTRCVRKCVHAAPHSDAVRHGWPCPETEPHGQFELTLAPTPFWPLGPRSSQQSPSAATPVVAASKGTACSTDFSCGRKYPPQSGPPLGDRSAADVFVPGVWFKRGRNDVFVVDLLNRGAHSIAELKAPVLDQLGPKEP